MGCLFVRVAAGYTFPGTVAGIRGGHRFMDGLVHQKREKTEELSPKQAPTSTRHVVSSSERCGVVT